MSDTQFNYTESEMNEAQFALDHHPDWSQFWESRRGQDCLDLAMQLDLKASTTPAYRRKWHNEGMRAAEQETES